MIDNKPWTDFEFTKENFPDFKLIVGRTFSYARLHDLSDSDKPEMQKYIGPHKESLPFDVWAKFNTVRAATIISLCSILEYFHETKKCPNSKHLRDTKIYSRLQQLRHFCAHIIKDRGREFKVMKEFRDLGIEDTFTKVAKELYGFVSNGIEKYLELGLFKMEELKNTKESKMFLTFINKRRLKEEYPPMG